MAGVEPTATQLTAAVALARVKEVGAQILSQRRPWSELLDRSAYARPESVAEATTRVRKNVAYFKVNYLLWALAVLAVSLLYKPSSLVVLSGAPKAGAAPDRPPSLAPRPPQPWAPPGHTCSWCAATRRWWWAGARCRSVRNCWAASASPLPSSSSSPPSATCSSPQPASPRQARAAAGGWVAGARCAAAPPVGLLIPP